MSDMTSGTSTEDAKDAARASSKRAPGRPWSDGEIRQVLLAPADRELLTKLAKRLKRSMDAIDVVRRIGATPYQEQSPKQRDGKFWKQVTQVASELEDLPPARPAAAANALPPPPVVAEPALATLPEAAPLQEDEPKPFEEDIVIAASPTLGVLEMLAIESVSGPIAVAKVELVPRILEVPAEQPSEPDAVTLVPTGEDSPWIAPPSGADAMLAAADMRELDPDTLVPLTPPPSLEDSDNLDDLTIDDVAPLDPGTMEMEAPDDPAEIRLLAQLRETASEADPFDFIPTDLRVARDFDDVHTMEVPSVAGMTLIGLPENGEASVVDLDELGIGMDAMGVGLETNPDLPRIVLDKLAAPIPSALAPEPLFAEGSGPAKKTRPLPATVTIKPGPETADFAKIANPPGNLPMLEIDLGVRRKDAPWVVARARRDTHGTITVRRAGPVRLSNEQMNEIARRFKRAASAAGLAATPIDVDVGHPDHFLAAANDLPHDVIPIGKPRKITVS